MWLFASSPIRDLFETKISTTAQDLHDLPNFLSRCSRILHSGASDPEVRIKREWISEYWQCHSVATADAAAHILLLISEWNDFSAYFSEVFLTLLR